MWPASAFGFGVALPFGLDWFLAFAPALPLPPPLLSLLLLAFGGGGLGGDDLPLPLGGNAVFSCRGRLQSATACFVDPHLGIFQP